jgi:hypothetical protein
MAKKILLGLTTITAGAWRKKVAEIDELGLKEIALFPTCLLTLAHRQELYSLLEKTKLEKIPHVHITANMEFPELDYLVKRFNTEVFNVHSELSSHPYTIDPYEYYKNIYVENMETEAPTENDLKRFAGLCVDFSHWESGTLSYGRDNPANLRMLALVKKYKIGVNHVSAVKTKPLSREEMLINQRQYHYDSHQLDNLSELDYMKKYKNYLADIISIELENPLKQQLEAKKYLEQILEL